MVVRDFNQVTSRNEKRRRKSINLNKCNQISDYLNYCNFFNLSASGLKFTWCNKRDGLDYTKVKLDKAILNEAWCDLFSHA